MKVHNKDKNVDQFSSMTGQVIILVNILLIIMSVGIKYIFAGNVRNFSCEFNVQFRRITTYNMFKLLIKLLLSRNVINNLVLISVLLSKRTYDYLIMTQ